MEIGEQAAQQAVTVTLRVGGYVGVKLLQLAIWLVAKTAIYGAKMAHTAYKRAKVVDRLSNLSQRDSLEYVELSQEQLKSLKSDFRKYGVKVAVVKDKLDPEHITVFFQSKQLANVERAMKNYLVNNIDEFKDLATTEELKQINELDLENEEWNLQEIGQAKETPNQIIADKPHLKNTVVVPNQDQIVVTINEKLWIQADDKTFVSRIPYSKNLVSFDISTVKQISPQAMLVAIDKNKVYEVKTPEGNVLAFNGDKLAKSYDDKTKQFSKTIKGQDLRDKLNIASKKSKAINLNKSFVKGKSKGLSK